MAILAQLKRGFAGGLLFASLAAWSATPAAAPMTTSEIPDFHAMAATAHRARPIGKADLLGHVWVADFFFTSCGNLCPRMSAQMRKLQNRLSPDVMLVSFTIDPDKDSLKTLETYAKNIDADPKRWFFLRMDKNRLAQLMTASFRMIRINRAPDEKKSDEAILSHNSRFVLVDARGRVRAVYDGLNADSLDFVVAAADILRKEAPATRG